MSLNELEPAEDSEVALSEKALHILQKYKIDPGNPAMGNPYRIFENIKRLGDPLSIEEHEILFDAFLFLANKSRPIKVIFPETLKQKFIGARSKIRYDMVVSGHIEGGNIPSLISSCQLNQNEQVILWRIFHELWENDSARDSDQINDAIGLYSIIDKKLETLPNITILDIGCGKKGNGMSGLVKKYGDRIKGYGMDLDIQEHPSNVSLVAGDARAMPFSNENFDIEYSCHVLYYFRDNEWEIIVKEALRTAKKGAMLLFYDKRGVEKYREMFEKNNIKATVVQHEGSILISKEC